MGYLHCFFVLVRQLLAVTFLLLICGLAALTVNASLFVFEACGHLSYDLVQTDFFLTFSYMVLKVYALINAVFINTAVRSHSLMLTHKSSKALQIWSMWSMEGQVH